MKKVMTTAALAAFLTPAIAMGQNNSDGSMMGPSGRGSDYRTSSGDNALVPSDCTAGDPRPACQEAALPSERRPQTGDRFYDNLPNGGSDAKSTNPEISGGPVTNELSPTAGSGSY